MSNRDDDLDALPSLLGTRWLGRAFRHLTSCVSTNDEAAAWARAGAPAGALVIADAQTGGRGRLRRSWHSPPGENLYFSAVLRPPIPPHRAPPLTLAAAVALAETVSTRVAPARLELKWPNDLLLDGRKLAGILTEMATSGSHLEHVVWGLGVNLGTRNFPGELASRATSLALALGRPVPRARFAADLALNLERWHDHYLSAGPAPVVAGWKSFARLFGRTVTVTTGIAGRAQTLSGVAEDVDSDGTLLLRTADGQLERVIAGELV